MSDPQNLNLKDVHERLELSSVHLLRLISENLPEGMSSGLLIDYKGSRHLCTAAHALHKGTLALQIQWDPKRRGTLSRALNLTAICSIRITSDLDLEHSDLDFAFCKIPFDDVPLHQELNQDGSGAVHRARPCTIYKDTDLREPDPDCVYGFSGQTKMCKENHPLVIISTQLCVIYPLKYIGEHNGLYAFQFPGVHPGHEYFEGCSGAPIVDMDGHVVALVCCGCPKQAPLIYGFPINRFKAVLEASASGILDNIS